MKERFLVFAGLIGSALSLFIGGMDTMLTVLCVLMAIDYISGVTVAIVFKSSPKTDSGLANSAIGFKGICKKLFMLLMVGVANCLDIVLTTEFCRSGIVIAFVANETLSIIENAGLMGIPIPQVLKNAVDLLNKKE